MTNKYRVLAALGALLAFGAWPHTGSGSAIATGPPCAHRTELVAYLKAAYGETAAGRGLRDDGLLLELFAGPSGSWTIIVTHPAGVSCLVSYGDMWETMPGHAHESVVPSARWGR